MRALIALVVLAGLAACAQPAQEEIVIVDPEPLSVEPVHTGKFK